MTHNIIQKNCYKPNDCPFVYLSGVYALSCSYDWRKAHIATPVDILNDRAKAVSILMDKCPLKQGCITIRLEK